MEVQLCIQTKSELCIKRKTEKNFEKIWLVAENKPISFLSNETKESINGKKNSYAIIIIISYQNIKLSNLVNLNFYVDFFFNVSCELV